MFGLPALHCPYNGEAAGTKPILLSTRNGDTDAIVIQKTSSTVIEEICNNDGLCTATIPVKGSITVSWSIQAVSGIDGRTFHSYPLRGEWENNSS